MIIGTAGHIDHGKTSLVKALTGIDADRLKEEKARGITLDLGFAHKPLADGGMLGFVDVPGHEKLVRHMLAGAMGMDHVMLVVAADDGPMPQTREHLAILNLLGLTRGVVVLSKCDVVTPQRRAEATAEVRGLLHGHALQGAPVLPVSSLTGEGVEALLAHLQQARAELPAARTQGQFRLAVDRCFTLAGIGTVVTGTAVAGRVAVGERLVLSPSGREVRVRGIQAHGHKAELGQAGQRLALNLAGIDKAEVQRGDWLLAQALHAPTQRLDVRLHLLPSEAKALVHWTPVHLHLGAVDVNARVALLEGEAIAPGQAAWVQLQLDRPIGALHGDRFVLRDQSAQRTIGGGSVVDAFPPEQRRRRAQRLANLAAWSQPTPEQALAALLALQPPGGLDAHAFAMQWNLSAAEQRELLAQVPHRALAAAGASASTAAASAVTSAVTSSGTSSSTSGGTSAAASADGATASNAPLAQALLFAPGQIERYGASIAEHLGAYHRKNADSPGQTQQQVQRAVRDKPTPAVFALLLAQLVRERVLKRDGPHLALATHDASLQGAEKQLWERLKPWLDEGALDPPRLSDMLLRDRNLRRDQVLRLMQRLQRMGRVHPVGAEYFIQTPHLVALATIGWELAQADLNKRLNVKAMREATGMSRHLSVPLVEYFDHIGLTQRDAIGRHFRREPRLVFGG